MQGPAKEIAVSMLEDLKSHVSAQHENRSIFDDRHDLADLDMTNFRASDEELGTDIMEPPAAQAGMLILHCSFLVVLVVPLLA